MRMLVNRGLSDDLEQRDNGAGQETGPARSCIVNLSNPGDVLSLPSVTKAPPSSVCQISAGLKDSPACHPELPEDYQPP